MGIFYVYDVNQPVLTLDLLCHVTGSYFRILQNFQKINSIIEISEKKKKYTKKNLITCFKGYYTLIRSLSYKL